MLKLKGQKDFKSPMRLEAFWLVLTTLKGHLRVKTNVKVKVREQGQK